MNFSNTSGYIDATVVYSRGKPDVFVIVNSVLLFICITVGIVGNSIVLYVYKTKFKADMVNRYFVPFLAVVDLLGLVICGSFEVTLNFMHFSFVNTYLCKSWWFLCGSVTFLSVLILLLIAVQRYLKIVKPAGRQMDFTLNRIALFCAVCFAIVCAVPLPIIYGTVPLLDSNNTVIGSQCKLIEDNHTASLVYFSCIGVIGTVIGSALAGLYFTTGRIIFRHVKQATFSPWNDKDMSITSTSNIHVEHSKGNVSSFSELERNSQSYKNNIYSLASQENQHEKENKRILYKCTLMFMLITVIYFVCYIPHVLIKAFKPVDVETTYDAGDITFIILSQIYIINNVCNPVLYAFMDTKFRWHLKELLHCHDNAKNNII